MTVRLKVRTGLINGRKIDVSVTRDSLPVALASAIVALQREGALTVSDLLRALRAERAVPAGDPPARTPGDPLGLGRLSRPRPPVVASSEWGLNPAALGAALRDAGFAAAAALARVGRMQAPPVPPPLPADPVQPIGLRGLGRGQKPPAE